MLRIRRDLTASTAMAGGGFDAHGPTPGYFMTGLVPISAKIGVQIPSPLVGEG
jgi:hypothetical protein